MIRNKVVFATLGVACALGGAAVLITQNHGRLTRGVDVASTNINIWTPSQRVRVYQGGTLLADQVLSAPFPVNPQKSIRSWTLYAMPEALEIRMGSGPPALSLNIHGVRDVTVGTPMSVHGQLYRYSLHVGHGNASAQPVVVIVTEAVQTPATNTQKEKR